MLTLKKYLGKLCSYIPVQEIKNFHISPGIDRERCELLCLTTAKVVLDQYRTKYENSFFPEQVCINAIYRKIFLELALRSIKQQLSLKNIHYITMATLLRTFPKEEQ